MGDYDILIAEGLSDWKIRYIDNSGSVIWDNKEILINAGNTPSLLHAIAHILCYSGDNDNKHNFIWSNCFTNLVNKYMDRKIQYKGYHDVEKFYLEDNKCG